MIRKKQINLKNKSFLTTWSTRHRKTYFFAFAQVARWNTVYEIDDVKYEYYIAMDKDTLNQYDDNDGKKPHVTQKETGTEVIFTQIQQFSKEEIVEKIRAEFFGFWN